MNSLAFVAGATGYTGAALVARLRQLGTPTIAHVRPDSPGVETWRARFEALGAEVDTTPWSLDALTARLASTRPAVVFALLGTTRKRAAREPGATYERVDYGLTRLLMDACVAAGCAPRFVYLSALGVGPQARGAYLQVRHRMETELRASGLPWTIARPAFITGPDRAERRVGERLGATLSQAFFALTDALGANLDSRYGAMTADQLARALVAAGFDNRAAGRVLTRFDLAQQEVQ